MMAEEPGAHQSVTNSSVVAQTLGGGDATVHYAPSYHYHGPLQPPPLDAAMLAAAEARLAALPVDTLPAVAPLPGGSRMPFSPNPLFVGRETDLRTLAAA